MASEPISINRNVRGQVGENYHRSMDIADIAKAVRKELKAKHPGWKFSVTVRRYSMGQSCDVRLTAVPAFVTVRNPEWKGDGTYAELMDCHARGITRYTREVNEVVKSAEAILQSYNRNNSDSQTDYFDVNFYGSVVVEVLS